MAQNGSENEGLMGFLENDIKKEVQRCKRLVIYMRIRVVSYPHVDSLEMSLLYFAGGKCWLCGDQLPNFRALPVCGAEGISIPVHWNIWVSMLIPIKAWPQIWLQKRLIVHFRIMEFL